MSVGDINSDAKGSGARYNSGKAPLHLIPLSVIVDVIKLEGVGIPEPVNCLENLGLFQTTQDPIYLDKAILDLDSDSKAWTDCAEVFDFGRKKYAEWNWAKGMVWSIPLGCAARHLLAWIEGEQMDKDSTLHHRGHAMCNLVMLKHYYTAFTSGNDLPDPKLFIDDTP